MNSSQPRHIGKQHWLLNFALNNGITSDEIEQVIKDFGIQTDGITLDMANYIQLLNWMVERLNDPALGIRLANEIRESEFGSGLMILYHVATIRNCCQSVARYHQIIVPGATIDFVEGDTESRLEYRVNLPASVDVSQEVEFAIAMIVNFSRSQLGPGFGDLQIHFMHKANGTSDQYRDSFGNRVLFEQPHNAVIFNSEILDHQVSNADPNMLEILRDHADTLREQARQKNDLIEQIKFYIARTIGSNDCSADNAASYLCMSGRNLTRKLNAQGTSFRELRNEIMEGIAKKALLDTDLSITEVALRLGYSEASAFNRAFKNVSGYTPQEYRQRK